MQQFDLSSEDGQISTFAHRFVGFFATICENARTFEPIQAEKNRYQNTRARVVPIGTFRCVEWWLRVCGHQCISGAVGFVLKLGDREFGKIDVGGGYRLSDGCR